MVEIKIKGYVVKRKGKRIVIKPHTRRLRKKGKKITRKKVGTFYILQDELGNFRGSQVEKFKKTKTKKIVKKKSAINKSTTPTKRKTIKISKRVKRKREGSFRNTKDLDEAFFEDKVSFDDWIIKRRKIMGLR